MNTDEGTGGGYDWSKFHGYEVPHYTQVPDLLFDEQLADLGHAELKVLLWIIRKTFGYGKASDAISLSQLQAGTGLGISSVKRAVRDLEAKGVIVVKRDLSKLGDSAVNSYALRLAEGGRPTMGLPSAHNGPHKKQSFKKQTEQQQQPPAKPRRKDPASAATAVVAIASKAKATEHGDTRERLQALGVTKATAGKLIKDHGPDLVARWTAYTEHKLKSGWLPQESPAAWLVSALRAGDWIIPEWFATPEEQAAAAEAQAQEQAAQALARRQAEAEEQEQAAAQRRATEARLNIDPPTADLWRQAVDLLTQRGEGSIALSSAYLLPVAGVEVARITSPVEFFCRMLAERREEIRRALSEVMGLQLAGVEVIKSEL